MGDDLVLLADRASFHIVCDPFFHPWPLITFLGFAKCFISTWMSRGRVVVHKIHDPLLDDVDRGYVNSCLCGYSSDFEFLCWQDCDLLIVFFPLVHSW